MPALNYLSFSQKLKIHKKDCCVKKNGLINKKKASKTFVKNPGVQKTTLIIRLNVLFFFESNTYILGTKDKSYKFLVKSILSNSFQLLLLATNF